MIIFRIIYLPNQANLYVDYVIDAVYLGSSLLLDSLIWF